MKTAIDTIDWNQEEQSDIFVQREITPVIEGLASGTIPTLDLTEPISIAIPPVSCFFHYNDLDPYEPVHVGVYCRSLAHCGQDFSLLDMVDGPLFDVLQMDVMVANEHTSAYTYTAFTTVGSQDGKVVKAAFPAKPQYPLPVHITKVLNHRKSPIFEAMEKCPGLKDEILTPYQTAVKTTIQVLTSGFARSQIKSRRIDWAWQQHLASRKN